MKSMLEKLTEDYDMTIGYGNGGHAVGFYQEDPAELIPEIFKFEKGRYTLRRRNEFYWEWGYDPMPQVDNAIPLKSIDLL